MSQPDTECKLESCNFSVANERTLKIGRDRSLLATVLHHLFIYQLFEKPVVDAQREKCFLLSFDIRFWLPNRSQPHMSQLFFNNDCNGLDCKIDTAITMQPPLCFSDS